MFDPSRPDPDPDPDYELAWPRELFRAEAVELLDYAPLFDGSWSWASEANLLLEEAFVGGVPLADLRLVRQVRGAQWGRGLLVAEDRFGRGFLRELVDNLGRLPEQVTSRPYWTNGRGSRPRSKRFRRSIRGHGRSGSGSG